MAGTRAGHDGLLSRPDLRVALAIRRAGLLILFGALLPVGLLYGHAEELFRRLLGKRGLLRFLGLVGFVVGLAGHPVPPMVGSPGLTCGALISAQELRRWRRGRR